MYQPDRKGYQWPADQLTTAEMAQLHALRSQTGLPINALLKLAVQVLAEKAPVEITERCSQNGKMAHAKESSGR